MTRTDRVDAQNLALAIVDVRASFVSWFLNAA
jgi:hypothetical protein